MELGGLHETVRALAGRDLGALSDAELREDLIELCRVADVLTCALAQHAAAADRRGVADEFGQVSTAKWMEWAAGVRAPEARKLIDAGLALDELPLVRDAWANGAISASAAQRIAKGRHPEHGEEYADVEAMLVDLAKGRWFADMDTVIRRYRQCIETEPKEHEGVFLSPTTDRWELTGTLSPLDGKTLSDAIAAATAPPIEGDTRTPAQRRAGALVHIARAFLGRPDARPAEATRVPNVHIIYQWANHTATVSGLPDMPVPDHDIGRLLCDCAVTNVVLGETGQPLHVGRTRRNATNAQRSAILVRDRHCRFPGCDRPPKWCEVHHVIPWEHDGPTDLDNLVLRCTHHHHVVHRPGWSAHFDGTTFTVTNPNGVEMTAPARAPVAA